MVVVLFLAGIFLFMYGVGNIVFLQKDLIERDKNKRHQILPIINTSKIVWSSRTYAYEQTFLYRSTYCSSIGIFLISAGAFLDKGLESPAIIFAFIGLIRIVEIEWRKSRFKRTVGL